jgi:hypothetical protein
MARAGIHLKGIESIYANAAGLTDLTSWGADISAGQLYGLDELSIVSLAVAKSTKYGTFGIMAGQAGYDVFNEQKIGIAYARKLGSMVSIGGMIDAFKINAQTIGSFNAMTFELGGQVKINKTVSINTSVFSPLQAKYTENTGIGSRFKLGFMYSPTQKVSIVFEADKPEFADMQIIGGVSYKAHPTININLGANPIINSYGIGISWQWQNKVKIGTSALIHQTLGTSPAISINYRDK